MSPTRWKGPERPLRAFFLVSNTPPLHRSKDLGGNRDSRARKPDRVRRGPPGKHRSRRARARLHGGYQVGRRHRRRSDGNGIAHVCALAGYDVMILNDVDSEADRLRPQADRIQHGAPGRRGLIDDAAMVAGRSGRIKPVSRSRRGRRVLDIAIEAATENEDTKKRNLRDRCCRTWAPRSRDAGDQHLVDLDHAAWPRRPTGPSASSACTS
jgi:hypothetical protein